MMIGREVQGRRKDVAHGKGGLVKLRNLAAALTVATFAAACAGTDADEVSGEDRSEGAAVDADGGDVGEAEETTLRLAHYLGPGNAVGSGLEWFIDEVGDRTGTLVIEPFWEGALLGAEDIFPGVGDGQADMGFFAATYHPSQLPLTQYSTLPFVSTDSMPIAQAFDETYEINQDFQAEYESQGVRALTFVGIPPTVLAGKDPLPDLESLQGVRIRATGSTARALDMVGSDVVGLSGTEIYEALQRGVLDGYASVNFSTAESLSFHEVAPHIYDPQLGTYGLGVIAINMSTWEALSDDERSVLTEVAAEWNERYAEINEEFEIEACQAVLDAGATVEMWDDSEIAEWRDQVGTVLVDEWENTAGDAAPEFRSQIEERLADFDLEGGDPAVERCIEASTQ